MNKKPTTEEITQAVAIIRRHNRWRRGDDDLEMCEPRLLGMSLDILCDVIDPPVVRRVLRLTLKRKWFDMIASGEKKEEYREHGKWIASRVNANKQYDVVEFKNGYGADAPTCVVEYKGYDWTKGNPAWGAESGKKYVVILLGDVLETPANPSLK